MTAHAERDKPTGRRARADLGMTAAVAAFSEGALLGVASWAHCAAMCGPISVHLTRALRPDGSASVVGILAQTEAGKALAYVVAGAGVGAAGSGAYLLLETSSAHHLLQALAAMGLVWIGLSLLGLTPAVLSLDTVFGPLRRWTSRLRGRGPAYSILAGLAWGLAPCGMVYSALLLAMLSGSAMSGLTVMLGFAVAVAPPVTAITIAGVRLAALAKHGAARSFAGASLILIGIISLAWPAHVLAPVCSSKPAAIVSHPDAASYRQGGPGRLAHL